MITGMMWLDVDAKRPLSEKVERAADYYKNKYGRKPDLCFVNDSMLEDETQVGKILVRPVRNIMRHHFWLGQSESS